MEWDHGSKAKEKSEKVLKLLNKLLCSGISNKEALKLLNNAFLINDDRECFATLDGCIINLETGNVEIMKLSGCPTYIKKENKIEIIKSDNLPVGIVQEMDIEIHNKTLNSGDILVLCTDGAIEYNTEYADKEMWLKELLKNIRTDSVQKIADLIVSESIDNGFGFAKDDISVIVMKLVPIDRTS